MKATITTNAPISDIALVNLEKFLTNFFNKHPEKLEMIRGENSGQNKTTQIQQLILDLHGSRYLYVTNE